MTFAYYMGGQEPNAMLQEIPITSLRRCPIQLRPVKKHSLKYYMLRSSIKDRGLIHPILVRPVGDYYEVVCGSNRFECMKDLRWEKVPCNVKELNDDEVLRYQMEEHNHIEVSPLEEATRLWQIVNVDKEMTIAELAFELNRHPDWVRHRLNLVNLSNEAKKFIDSEKLPLYIAYNLSSLPIDSQDALLELFGTMTNKEFHHLVQDRVRQFRQGLKDARIGMQTLNRETIGPELRTLNEIVKELRCPIAMATVLCDLKAETKREIWDAALTWASRQDPKTIEERRIKYERDQRKKES